MQVQQKDFLTHLKPFCDVATAYFKTSPGGQTLDDTERLYVECKKLVMVHRRLTLEMPTAIDVQKSAKRKTLKDAGQVLIKEGKSERIVNAA